MGFERIDSRSAFNKMRPYLCDIVVLHNGPRSPLKKSAEMVDFNIYDFTCSFIAASMSVTSRIDLRGLFSLVRIDLRPLKTCL